MPKSHGGIRTAESTVGLRVWGFERVRQVPVGRGGDARNNGTGGGGRSGVDFLNPSFKPSDHLLLIGQPFPLEPNV